MRGYAPFYPRELRPLGSSSYSSTQTGEASTDSFHSRELARLVRILSVAPEKVIPFLFQD